MLTSHAEDKNKKVNLKDKKVNPQNWGDTGFVPKGKDGIRPNVTN